MNKRFLIEKLIMCDFASNCTISILPEHVIAKPPGYYGTYYLNFVLIFACFNYFVSLSQYFWIQHIAKDLDWKNKLICKMLDYFCSTKSVSFDFPKTKQAGISTVLPPQKLEPCPVFYCTHPCKVFISIKIKYVAQQSVFFHLPLRVLDCSSIHTLCI